LLPFSQQQRAVFFCGLREEMPLAEIADVLGLKVGSTAFAVRVVGAEN